MTRTIFMVSDGTGITAETLGHSLMTQFDHVKSKNITIPYVNSLTKAYDAVDKINSIANNSKDRPIVFVTIVQTELLAIINESNAFIVDLFSSFLSPLEKELGVSSSYSVGKSHAVKNSQAYRNRMEAVDYALQHDDGLRIKGYVKADIILIGVSRSGKTPSCLYMALHFGAFAANYPFTDEDLERTTLPVSLKPYKNKLFGLTIDCDRLQQIRSERKPNSHYASFETCRKETGQIEAIYQHENIPYINSTACSIEEISTKVLSTVGFQR